MTTTTKIISETERSQKSQKMSGPRHQLTKNFSRKSEHACFVDTGNKSFFYIINSMNIFNVRAEQDCCCPFFKRICVLPIIWILQYCILTVMSKTS